jgi:hypothetical protein
MLFKKLPVIEAALRYAECPTCHRIFEPSCLYCPVCEGPTRLKGYFPPPPPPKPNETGPPPP